MVQQEQVLSHAAEGAIPEQRNGVAAPRRGTQLRVDARRNLESVLRAAREVFGELGYGAPMEEVARRAGVGVGTVYRRFPSKEVLVHRIASEEVQWLTTQAREALEGDPQPWEALAGYLSRAVASGAGRLLPPEAYRRAEVLDRASGPQTALPDAGGDGASASGADVDPASLVELLGLLSRLVERAREAGELRAGVSVADVVLVLTASVPAQPGAPRAAGGAGGGIGGGADDDGAHAGVGAAPDGTAARLLGILLAGLRAGA
ncbi:TetR/AcrR family transcriptional regulator [Streptacidiphilus sp. PB12-B1b]|uniref:TetR/AcrR family transcriptional regulator n=1 Tax=Streptacidiphilus sp. PB12-B1b TaxID=2705012 RepID=UPI0015FE08FF|nr:TetR/AcrR family transcriptional regulator [Streptacidiphilus sp. PB12-B1b]QMU79657.1 TetR/AcrR family transcriptional regulator [Streptacidiphilus sp. PB12-B1b]